MTFSAKFEIETHSNEKYNANLTVKDQSAATMTLPMTVVSADPAFDQLPKIETFKYVTVSAINQGFKNKWRNVGFIGIPTPDEPEKPCTTWKMLKKPSPVLQQKPRKHHHQQQQQPHNKQAKNSNATASALINH